MAQPHDRRGAPQSSGPRIRLPQDLQDRLPNDQGWHYGPVYYVCGSPPHTFAFGILEDGTARPYSIDTRDGSGEHAVRVVFLAYEKGMRLCVYEDPASPGVAQAVVA